VLPVPRYGVDTLAELLPSIAASLGVAGEVNALGLPPARRVCLLLVDGLGERLLRAHADLAPFLNSLSGPTAPDGARDGARDKAPDGGRPPATLTTAFPSTTATSLAVLGTGLPPGAHGLVGYTVAVPGTGRLMNSLRWDDAVDPRAWQPCPTVLERAADSGVRVTQVNSPRFEESGLTLAALRGGHYQGAEAISDRVPAVASALRAGERSLVYTYYAELDATGHALGVGSDRWRERLAFVDRLAARLVAALPADGVLYVTADHGMLDVAETDRLDLALHPELTEDVLLLGGEPRARYLYTRAGAADEVAERWSRMVGDRAWVFTRARAVELGLFGPRVEPWVLPRIGDVVVAAAGPLSFVHTVAEPSESRVVGAHGSLTEVERHVPLLVATR
jgi:predicted AlkP superfamily pyrophosphatase or phosphodiesterase